MPEFRIATQQAEQWIDITRMIQEAVTKAGAQKGACLVTVPHTTAGCTIQENADPDVVHDALMALGKMVPHNWPYRHGEGNSTAHIKTSLMGSSAMIPLEKGQLVLGTWQGVYLCEFDGPRTRRVRVDFLGALSSEVFL